MGTAWNIKASAGTGKNLPSTVWTGCQVVSGIRQSRNTIGAVKGGEIYA